MRSMTFRPEQVQKAGTERRSGGGGWRVTLEVAVRVDAHRWQLHTISARAADLLLRTMEPRALWNLRVRPASCSSACSCGRSRESSLPLQLATRFNFNNEKLVYYQLLWQSFRFKKGKNRCVFLGGCYLLASEVALRSYFLLIVRLILI